MIKDPEIARAIQDLAAGRVGTVGEVTLETSGTTTTVTTRPCSSTSFVGLSPLNAGAAAEGIPQVVPGNGQFVITHTASASPARTYRYCIFTNVNR